MSIPSTQEIRNRIDEVYRKDSRRIFATLIRMLGEFDLAEEALHEAFTAAVEKWAVEGIPNNPRAWLVSTGRFKGIDIIRRRVRFDDSLPELVRQSPRNTLEEQEWDDSSFRDDHLRLIFTCCHPALNHETQVALTLREVCGLTTEEVARAFLSAPATIAQRIVRGKGKIRDAGIPYEVPSVQDLPERIESVLSVVYLVFNEGYSASSGDQATRTDLSAEAIRLGRVLRNLLPNPDVTGLLALMLLHDSRRDARMTPKGELILLEDQDRSLWNQAQIAEGKKLVEQALSAPGYGAYPIQAAIAAVHADAPSTGETDWEQIAALYDVLMSATPSPVIELNRAVAISMRDGVERGLELVNEILQRGELNAYHLAYAVQADFYRRLGRSAEARTAYQHALSLAKQQPERRFLEKRLRELA